VSEKDRPVPLDQKGYRAGVEFPGGVSSSPTNTRFGNPWQDNDSMPVAGARARRVDDIAIKFLRMILPEEGYLAVTAKSKTGSVKSTVFAEDVYVLWDIIGGFDNNGLDAYHGCASFRNPRNDPPGTAPGSRRFGRTHYNALGARCLWADFDCGSDKPYKEKEHIKDALVEFRERTKLPVPLIVSSGSGIHAYWVLDRMLAADEWKATARKFKTLMHREGLHADPTRTADISSVLRTPGTHNHKRGTTIVGVDEHFLSIMVPAETDWLIEKIDTLEGGPSSVRRFVLGASPAFLHRTNGHHVLNALLGPPREYPPSYADKIAEECGQLASLRDANGSISEPVAHACAGVLAFCVDGREKAHEWAAGYGSFSRVETDAWIDGKLDRAAALSGPTTCERFHDLKPEVCEACKRWKAIRTPIQLGREAAKPRLPAVISNGAGGATPGWEYTAGGVLKPRSYINTAVALDRLGVKFRHDLFHNKKIVEGDAIENLGPELSDAACRALRVFIITRFSFDPGIENVQQAAERACEANRFDPKAQLRHLCPFCPHPLLWLLLLWRWCPHSETHPEFRNGLQPIRSY
jgi:hypothetical protein